MLEPIHITFSFLQKKYMRYTYIDGGVWVREDHLLIMWAAIADSPLTTNLETMNAKTIEADMAMDRTAWVKEQARRRALVVDYFKPAASVLVEHMFPERKEGLEFANLKLKGMWPETQKKFDAIECEFVLFCLVHYIFLFIFFFKLK
jgi:hypothetical protein